MANYYGYPKGSPDAMRMMLEKEPQLYYSYYENALRDGSVYIGNGVTLYPKDFNISGYQGAGISKPTPFEVMALGDTISYANPPTQETIKEAQTMASAGQDLTLYQKIDSAVGGLLPGGVEAQPGAVSTALRVAGLTAGAAAIAGIGYGAYKLITGKDGNQKLIKRKRMNFANPKALNRANRRLVSFKKHYAKVVKTLGYHVTRGGK